MQERRISVSKLSTRSAGDGSAVIRGYAAKFNRLSQDLGGFREMIRFGTFRRAVQDKQDVRCLFNHNADLILGRTRSSTLRLYEDRTGLGLECELPDTSYARDLLESIRRGDVSQMSFGFITRADKWYDGRDYVGTESVDPDEIIRELTDVDLLDVSPVCYPAYEDTEVSANE